MDVPNRMRAGLRVDVDGARAYVLAHGGMREKARLASILDGAPLHREAARELEALQNPDGGFPLRQVPGEPSSLDTTCFLLDQMKDLKPLAGSPMAARALAFLRRSQQPDGTWREAPPVETRGSQWVQAEQPSATAYLTACAVYTLLSLEPTHLDPIRRGEAYLRRTLAPDGSGEGTYSQTLAMAAAIWYRLDGPGSEAASWCYRLLLTRQPDALELAWWLSCALEMGLGGSLTLPIVQLLHDLAAMQQHDGAWPPAEGMEVEATLQALRVLSGYGAILGRDIHGR